VRAQAEALADAWACSARAMSRGPMLISSGHGSLSARSSALGGSLAALAAGAAAAADAQPVLPAPLLAHSAEAPCGRSTPATAISSRASSIAEVKQQQHFQPTSSSRSSDSDPGVQPQQEMTAAERMSRLRHRSPDGRFVWAELAEKRTLVRTTQSPLGGQVQAELPNTARGLAGTALGAQSHRASGNNTGPAELPGSGRCCCVSPGRRSAPATTPTAPTGVATAALPVLLGTQWTANPGGSSHSSYSRPAQQGSCIPRPRQGGSAGCMTGGRGGGNIDPVLAGPSPRVR